MTAFRNLLLLGIVVFVAFGSVALARSGMAMGHDGQMSRCPLMGVPVLCHMSPLDHAIALQGMLTAIPFSGLFAFFMFVLFVFSVTPLAPKWLRVALKLPEPPLQPPALRGKTISRHTLQDAFSNGILHSKAF